jgi:hypothetical protein
VGVGWGTDCPTKAAAEESAAGIALGNLEGLLPVPAVRHVNPVPAAKNRLQEYFQARGPSLPRYETERIAGPDHEPVFRATVLLPGVVVTRDIGTDCPTKAAAEESAAGIALGNLEGLLPVPAVRHGNPVPAAARRVILIDLENQHGGLGFVPLPVEFVLGFVHEVGAHAV